MLEILPSSRWRGASLGVLAGILACTGAARAQDGPVAPSGVPQTAPAAGEQTDADEEKDEGDARKKRDILILPVPLSTPATGTGLVVGVVMFETPADSKMQRVTGAGVAYTSTGTRAIGALHTRTFDHDRIRMRALATYTDAELNFYGVGPEAGDRNDPIDLRQREFTVLLEGQVRVFTDGFAGVRLKYSDIRSTPQVPDPTDPDAVLLAPELKNTLSLLGPIVTYDTRDDSLNPRKGVLATANWMFGITALGSTFSQHKFQANANFYVPLGERTVIAARASMCGASQYRPIHNLCFFGSQNDLRGYEAGRYRDRASWAVQGELRQKLFGRFGGVVFAGVGGIAPSLGDVIGHTKFLPSAGIGVRYQPLRKTNINLRLDLAVGRDSTGVYFGIAEAF